MQRLILVATLLAASFFSSEPAQAGNLTKKFGSVAPPPPPPTVRQDFYAVRGRYNYDSPQPHLTPRGGPRRSNETPSVAIPLTKPLTSVGKLK